VRCLYVASVCAAGGVLVTLYNADRQITVAVINYLSYISRSDKCSVTIPPKRFITLTKLGISCIVLVMSYRKRISK